MKSLYPDRFSHIDSVITRKVLVQIMFNIEFIIFVFDKTDENHFSVIRKKSFILKAQ